MRKGTPKKNTKKLTVFAVSSSGGHWVQLLRLRPAFADQKAQPSQLIYVTTDASSKADIDDKTACFHTVRDGNRDTKLSLIMMALQIFWLLLRYRPDVVISTGAAPGYFACRFARLVGAKSLFIDSVANAQEMSLSAKLSTTHADRVFSQWPSVAEKAGVEYHGNVL